ncbi:MAG: metallophosphoesterase [Gammaproteobacteria bacterium]|nr:metallophosphoesterase [Gammaproteobacteria bacterium]
MRIGLISDTHNEFLRCDGQSVPNILLLSEVDVIVLAGDIDTEAHGARWAVRQSERLDLPVIYLTGNHEFYSKNKTISEIRSEIKETIKGTNVHYSEHLSFVIDDVKFICASLWIDFNLLGPSRVAEAMTKGLTDMSDFESIREKSDMFIIPNTMMKWHNQAKEFIARELAEPFSGKRVVVTHHAPSANCLPEGWDRTRSLSLISTMYASNLDGLIEKYQPAVWLHGHIHTPKTHTISQTVVMSNPRGYPQLVQGDKSWCKAKVLKV